MENFCYWQEDASISFPLYQNKICLLRQQEYKIEKELGIENKTNIFCPFLSIEQVTEMDCIAGIKINEQNSNKRN